MDSVETTSSGTDTVRSRAGKYLTFELNDEFYGLEILRVREIISMQEITEVPRTPEFVKGVINLRGNIIPVVDLRMKFGLEKITVTRETCTIVVDLNGVQTGLMVDRVAEVQNIVEESIEDAPSFGSNADTDFLLGMGKTEERVIMLLDINAVLDAEEVAMLGKIQKDS
jgi:purine-binding chemotaxis protein CheW